MGQGVGGFVYLSDDQENVSRVSPAGRAFFSDSYERIKLHSPINVTSASGGSQLESAPVGKVFLRSESGNGIMWWGTGDDAPYSGHGYPLFGGEQSIPIPVTNFSAIQIVANVSGQIVYPIGFLNGSDVTLSNTTPNVPDIIAPFIISNSPISGLSGIALNSDISVRFSETINPSSVVSGVLRLSPAHNVTIFRDNSNPTDVVLRPNQNLSGTTVYFATLVSGTVTDVNGNIATSGRGWPFTTTAAPPPPDVTAPTISGITPVSGSTGTGNSVSPTILFSEQMLSGTINPTTIYLTSISGAGAGNVTADILLDAGDRKTVTIDPLSDLNTGVTYYINVTTGVQDLAANPMTVAKTNHPFSTSYSFTELYNVVSTADNNQIGSGQDFAAGLKINAACSLKDQIPKKVVMSLRRGSTATTGTPELRIYNGSHVLVSTFGSFAGTQLTTSDQDITVTNLNNTTALANGYQLLLYYTGAGAIRVNRTTSNLYTGAIYADIASDSSFNTTSTIDISWKIYS